MSGIENLLDHKLFFFINRSLSNPLFDAFMPLITDMAVSLLLPVVLFILYIDRRKALIAVILALSALALSDGLSNLLKHFFERPRPFVGMSDVLVLAGRGKSFSMPSAHAANTASAATVLIVVLSWLRSRTASLSGHIRSFLVGYLVAVAVTIAFSRVYIGVHYPSDVLVGLAIGTLAGLSVTAAYARAEKLFRVAPYQTVLGGVLLVLSLFRIYYILAGPLDLSPDEAQYWDWSRRLDLSYYSKGPAIAYIMAIGRTLLGNTEIGIRLPAVFFSLSSSLVLYGMSRDIMKSEGYEGRGAPEAAGLLSALMVQIVPLFSTYGIVMTIDSPLIFFWSVSLYLFYLAQRDRPEGSGMLLWVLLGLTVGTGLLVKYTMAFFYLSAFLYLVADRRRRRLLASPGPWLSFFVSVLCFVPVLVWNAKHGWVTFLHTAGQAHISDGFTITVGRFFEFIGSQLGVVSPVILIVMLISLFSLRKKSAEGSLLFWFSIPVLLFFTLKSLQGKVQANWALPAYIAGFVSLGIYTARYWHEFRRATRGVLIAGAVLSLLISSAAHYPSILNLPPKMDPTSRLRGWQELGREVSRITSGMKAPYFIFSDKYQVTSELAFYVDGNPTTYNVNLGRRMNQYDIWPGFHDLKGYSAVFVMVGDRPLPERIGRAFEGCQKSLFTVREERRLLRDYSIFRCSGFRGMERKAAEKF
ncbi:MAG: phosphatase PAP2 family protein [Nitrospirae bacterium]|nr:phosphatase PAP2 family protein [Nitrospirota bacterium]